jgi:hypothetical protein
VCVSRRTFKECQQVLEMMVTGKSGENQERTKKKMMKEEERDEDEKKYK